MKDHEEDHEDDDFESWPVQDSPPRNQSRARTGRDAAFGNSSSAKHSSQRDQVTTALVRMMHTKSTTGPKNEALSRVELIEQQLSPGATQINH